MKNIKQNNIYDFLFNSEKNQENRSIELGASKRYLVKVEGGWYEIVSEQEKENMKSD
jgi:hypothetical protein